jgi:hypothetical protein
MLERFLSDENVTGGSVSAGSSLHVDFGVYNAHPDAQQVRISGFRLENQNGITVYSPAATSAKTISQSGGTDTFTYDLPSSVTGTPGTYYYVFETQTFNGQWVKTDSWPRALAVTITP